MIEVPKSFDEIKARVDQRDLYTYLFRYCFGKAMPEIDEMVISPLRTEYHPSFKLFVSRYNELAWKDYGLVNQRAFGYDALGLYRAWKHGQGHPVSYQEALGFLAGVCATQDFNEPGLLPAPKRKAKMYVRYTANFGPHLAWWEAHGINRDILRKFDVFLASKVFINGKQIAKTTAKNPVYLYLFNAGSPPSWQAYQPKKKRYRFFSENIDIMGLKQLPESGEHCIVTSSYKDVMVLYTLGFPAICTSSEATAGHVDYASLRERFRRVSLLLDNDKTGTEATAKIRNDYPYVDDLSLPAEWPKDPADCILEGMRTELLQHLNT